ncbi:MAG: radical SAM protein [bacterium]|jgi:MoaA/NifB/PqqE/SkfB family radical SAM enzyme
MNLSRKETWGVISYDTDKHCFSLVVTGPHRDLPNPTKPVLLNIDLTLRCNMECRHCVASDMVETVGSLDAGELVLGDRLFNAIEASPFLVVVITGGEPFLPSQEDRLTKLLRAVKNKGIIVDTNGTIVPSEHLLQLLRRQKVLVRISWDTPVPREEVKLRCYPKGMYATPLDAIRKKEHVVKALVEAKVPVAIQTVIHKGNYQAKSLDSFPQKMSALGVTRWVLQRFIPSHRMRMHTIDSKKALRAMEELAKKAARAGVSCDYKADLRHNSVYLLVGDRDLYTQSNEEPGKKIPIGKLEEVDYFAWVSQTDHAYRYLLGSRGRRE